MSFNATLTVEDKTFRVFSFDYSAYRDVDKFGRPTSVIYGVKMIMEIEHKPDCVMLHEWAYKNYEVKGGSVLFMKRDSQYQKDIEFRFKESYISKISLYFANTGDQPLTQRLEIISGNIEIESEGKLAMYDGEMSQVN